MCIICVEFEMSRLTIEEARRNLAEMSSVLDPEHVEEIERVLSEKEMEQMDDDEFREEFKEVIADGSDQERIMKKILTEWRRFLKEESGRATSFPEKLYHAIPIGSLASVRDNGIVNLPSDQEMSNDKFGIPTCQDLQEAGSYGNVILEIDGNYLQATQQYEPEFNSKGCRVKMKDSAADSGSGADPMVDRLGSSIPFEAVTGAVFMGTPPVEKLKEMGFGNMQISSLNSEGELKVHHEPQDQAQRLLTSA